MNRCVYTGEHKGYRYKVYIRPYDYDLKIKYPNERKYCYEKSFDFKREAIDYAISEINELVKNETNK